mgnify:CR=1 FL=1
MNQFGELRLVRRDSSLVAPHAADSTLTPTGGQRVETATGAGLDDEDLAELDEDGPADTVRLNVYSSAQHFASMQSLDQHHHLLTTSTS